ncbi:MAG: hypothetical protein DMH00_04695 [Acidobacteria bacterium]|nr:MAG: hypothetical protein DMH00_04695 [Acidobacteriota bacterium]
MKAFSPRAEMSDRAVQAWQILVGKAMNRQTVTYLGLSRLMYQKDAPGVLDKILGHIAYFCNANDLPPLTSIVVGKGRGTPGNDIPVDLSKIDAERERVYEHDWYDIYSPSRDELRAAYEAHVK